MSARAEHNLASLLTAAAREHGPRTALVARNERVSYDRLDARAGRFAAALRSYGVSPGDRVGILLPNSPAWVAAYYGTLRLGAIAVPLNVLLRDGEIADRLADAGACALVADRDPTGVLPWLDPATVEPDGSGGTAGVAAVNPGDTAVLLYTSGTTGGPKGAELTHRGLTAVARGLGTLLGVGPDDVVFGAAPLAHILGQSAAMNMTIAAGASVALVERFEPAAALELVTRERVSVFLGVPTMCLALLQAAEVVEHVPRIRIAHCGGAPTPVETLHAFAERFGCAVLEGYGMTETAGTVTSHRVGRPVKPGSVGEPLDGTEVRIAGDGSGEVLTRGPGLMRGYWRNPEATRAALSPDGWFATGDVGRLDDDGYLFLVDRKKDVILRGGYNVYPREVEEALHEHPGVRQAVVLGVPDPLLGEEVVALVVARGAIDIDEIDTDELRAFARKRVAAYAYPRLVVLVDELPLGPSGKVLRRAIDRAPLRLALDAAAQT
jgi:long-chain acyl-CoA synthetase